MQYAMVRLASLGLDVALRIWLKDEKPYIINNALDIKRFVEDIGCDLFSRRQLETNIGQCINNISEKLYLARFFDGIEEIRKREIVDQIVLDLESIDVLSEELLKKVMLSKDITSDIMKNSEKERSIWNEKEKGAYNNCLRFIADAIIKFTLDLPAYSREALKILYSRNEEIWCKFEKQLEEICALLKGSESTQVEFKEFQIDYLRNVVNINSKVELFGSGISKRKVKRYDLSTSYIELYCKGIEEEDIDHDIEISKVFDYGNIVWIGGEAGGGKTTFLQWIATCAATNNEEIDTIKGLVPIVLKLREIDFPINYKKEIEKITKSACPDGWIEYLFKYDKVLLLFDGLDEISESNRNKVYEEIERIYNDWQGNRIEKNQSDKDNNEEQIEKRKVRKRRSKIVVTSRMYVEDELECDHCFFEIMRMKMTNIEKFVKYWHNTILKDISEKPEKIREHSKSVIDSIANSPSLRNISGTPLLCAMICALGYTNDKIIPTNKLELYDKCCHMLVSERDEERHISYDKRFDNLDYAKKERVLEDIAYYMMNVEKAAMPKEEIVAHLRAFLKDSTLIEEKELRENPETLVDYLSRRTGIIREMSVGTIDFIHKTFMEYIASKAIIRRNEFNIIPLKAIKSFWKEAVVMCCGQLSRENATSQLKELLCLYEKTNNIEYIFIASLCAKGTNDIEISINNQIDNLIKNFIPPKKKYVSQLSKIGDIIIPFLYDNKTYSETDRSACLTLLDRVLFEVENAEIVPVIFSYVQGIGNDEIKSYAISILGNCQREWIEEYSIREKISDWLLSELVTNTRIKLTDDILSLIMIEKIKGELATLKDVTIRFNNTNVDDRTDRIDPEIYREFANIKKITLENVSCSYQLEILKSIECIDEISIEVCNDSEIIIDKLKFFSSVKNIKVLNYLSNDLSYICTNDLASFRNLETVYLELGNDNLEMHFSDNEFSSNIKKIYISVTYMGYMENEREIALLLRDASRVEVDVIKDSGELYGFYDK